MSRRPVKHSVTLNGHRTSVSLETEFWQALRDIAAKNDTSLNALVAKIDVQRGTELGLASAIRLFILQELQSQLAGSQIDAR